MGWLFSLVLRNKLNNLVLFEGVYFYFLGFLNRGLLLETIMSSPAEFVNTEKQRAQGADRLSQIDIINWNNLEKQTSPIE